MSKNVNKEHYNLYFELEAEEFDCLNQQEKNDFVIKCMIKLGVGWWRKKDLNYINLAKKYREAYN